MSIAVTTLLAYEVFDPKNTSPHVKYCHLLLYLPFIRTCEYLSCLSPFPGVLVRQNPSGFGGSHKTSNAAVTTMLAHEVLDPNTHSPMC